MDKLIHEFMLSCPFA